MKHKRLGAAPTDQGQGGWLAVSAKHQQQKPRAGVSMSLKFKFALGAYACLLVGCAHGDVAGSREPVATSGPEARIGVTPRNQIVPLLDAHQHLMGPLAMAVNVRAPSPPEIAIPGVLADLLAAREKGVDGASYDALFTPDAMLLADGHARWWTGKARILDALGGSGRGLRFVPTSYALDGSAGYLAGVLRGPSGRDAHTFVLGLKKGQDGRWRIASETKPPIAPPAYAPVIDAERLIAQLDDAGIRYATVLSTAYWFEDPEKQVEDRPSKTRAENDWVIAETQKYPDRLIPFCGISPIADYAIDELERCAARGVPGVKIHRNSKFDPSRPADMEKLKRFFGAANKHKLAIVIHLRGDPQLYIDHIFPEAPDVAIQIAHLGGSGADWKGAKVFADAIQASKPGTKHLYLDLSSTFPIEDWWNYGNPAPFIGRSMSAEEKDEAVALLRRVGLGRILYGSDMPLPWFPSPRDWWRRSILTLPFTDGEIRDIADNAPPYVRPGAVTTGG